MGFMEYSNMHQCNIIPQHEFEELITEVFDVVATNISRSLGPLGSSATILNGMMTEATKDGYSILSNYRFNNKYKRLILNLIKAPCTKMNNTVGDGTTTVIALTNALFQLYRRRENDFFKLYRLPRDLIKTWDALTDEIVERIKSKAVPLDPEDYEKVYNLAYVVSNGNKEVSSQISKVYRESKSPAIKLKDSPTNQSYIESTDGFSFPTNAIDSVYVTDGDLSMTERDVYTMIFAQKITRDIMENIIIPVSRVIHTKGEKLVIIAPSYDDYMAETMLGQYASAEIRQFGSVQTIMTQYRLSDTENGQRDDLATILRAKTITRLVEEDIENAIGNDPQKFINDAINNSTSPLYRMIGHADKVFISCKNGSIFSNSGIEDDPEYQDALKRANAELELAMKTASKEQQSYSHKIYDARARVLQLKMKNYIYYIGADSDLQKQILWDSIEDVVKCMRSAIRCGVVPGCQLTIMKVCSELIEELQANKSSDPLKLELVKLIKESCETVYSKVLHGPDNHGIVKLISGWEGLSINNPSVISKLAVLLGNGIVRASQEKNCVYDLESRTFNPNIITSAETDCMVIKSATELIKILISGNQCIFIDEDVNSSHQETREVYV